MSCARSFIRWALLLGFVGVWLGCSSVPNKPEDIKVEISREKPTQTDCRELGAVTGKSLSTKATSEEVLEDLKKDAQLKGANFVWLEAFSSLGTAAKGMAYFCP